MLLLFDPRGDGLPPPANAAASTARPLRSYFVRVQPIVSSVVLLYGFDTNS